MKEKFIENGIEYVKCGDYYIPNLTAPKEQYQIGILGKRARKVYQTTSQSILYHLIYDGQVV